MTRCLENLGDGRRAKVFRVDLEISVERWKVRSIERFRRIDRGPEFEVRNYAVVTGSDTGCEDRAIDIRRLRLKMTPARIRAERIGAFPVVIRPGRIPSHTTTTTWSAFPLLFAPQAAIAEATRSAVETRKQVGISAKIDMGAGQIRGRNRDDQVSITGATFAMC